ncbi:hypothetical protein [Legionella spiritensis]|uniref:Uncharacterized protein n=1 Tax=Legionella spiritensis TaxID=452 RepID=A0A0W0Z9H5_LEGSP|nr:hypothetical protein [Legionella spiritensis]KTD65745.1 hypothetical protein Lspi_0457 [Legionella spiritensis]SNV42763.1 Uncharacterised protein [Legionella spiritensis]VEG90598.1 Uncharacterised protein [Legionella spiritensis]
MNGILKGFAVITLGLSATMSFAGPSYLVTHNDTSVESKAYVAGIIPAPTPAAPNKTTSISWIVVKMACYGHTTNNKCPALIKMATNTAHPVELGTVEMDLDSGDITPKKLSANGYTLTVNGPAEATLTQN